MNRLSDRTLSAGWPVIADDLRKHERDRRVAAAVAETDAMMDRAAAFDTDAHATREVLTVIAEIILIVLAVVAAAAWGGAWLVGALP